MSKVILTGALCAVSLAAQSPVSPAARATSPGNTFSAVPFSSGGPIRYQELHSGLPANLTVRGLSWRQNDGSGTFSGTRALDMELAMGRTVRADIVRFNFQSNYSAGRTVVLARRTVNFGPQGTAASPAPFQGMSVVFDAPFVFTSGSLGWDAKIYASSGAGSFAAADAEAAPQGIGTDRRIGNGCTATGNQDPMSLDTLSVASGFGTFWGTFVRAAPANAPLVLALGASNPNLPVPGLCTNLHTDLLTTLGMGSTDSTGTFAASGSAVFMVQRTFAGQSLFAQAFAFDAASSHAIPLLGSNGVETTFASPQVFPDVSRIYAEGNADALLAPFRIDSLGTGLVTRFDT